MLKANYSNLFRGVDENVRHGCVLAPIKRLRKNLAFTLAEVLITLGIIGIVAAMVIPSLINAYQKHVTVTRLKQTYAQITQAVKLSEADNGDLSGWDMSTPDWHNYDAGATEKFARTYIVPYLKYNHLCGKGQTSCTKYSSKYLHGGRIAGLENYFTIVLMNGVILKIFARDTWSEIFIDINGSSGANTLGKDLFVIVLNKTAAGVPMKNRVSGVFMYGNGFTREQLLKTGYNNYICSMQGGAFNGYYCGEVIRLDGWKISKDYPW